MSTGTSKQELSILRESVWQIASQYVEEADDVKFRATVVMVAALFVGPNEREIIDLTGYAPESVHEVASRLRASGLWQNDVVDYQEWDDRTQIGYIHFVMDLGVAEGILMRTGQKRGGKYLYRSLVCDSDPQN